MKFLMWLHNKAPDYQPNRIDHVLFAQWHEENLSSGSGSLLLPTEGGR